MSKWANDMQLEELRSALQALVLVLDTKHTPAPWSIDLESAFTYGGDSREVVALTTDRTKVVRGVATLLFDTDAYPDGKSFAEDLANARLIAAAPVLLRSCELVSIVLLKLMETDVPDQRRFQNLMSNMGRMLKLAVDEAKGGAS